MPEGEFLIATTSVLDRTKLIRIYKASSRKEAKKFTKRYSKHQMRMAVEHGGHLGHAVLIGTADTESAAEWLREEKQFRKQDV